MRTRLTAFILLALAICAALWLLHRRQPGVARPDSGAHSEQVPFRDYAPPAADDELAVDRIVSSEELIRELTPRLGRLKRSLLNLKLPDHYSTRIFADQVFVRDLASTPPADPIHSVLRFGITGFAWPLEERAQQHASGNLALWQPLLDELAWFQHLRLHFLRGQFTDQRKNQFESEIALDGLARLSGGRWRAIDAVQQVRWQRVSTADVDGADEWRISDWNMSELRVSDAGRLLFSEALDTLIPDAAARARARFSQHEARLIDWLKHGGDLSVPAQQLPYMPYFQPHTELQHPGVSVVDIDNDGWDDLYVMVRWGRNRLYRNRGNGAFDEVAAKWGLDIDSVSTSGIFADFDNDGDPDLILGRSLERSMLMLNEDGRFVDRSQERMDGPLPYLVASVSAVDYNSDGLLDIYLCTYGLPTGTHTLRDWSNKFLPANQARALQRRYYETDESQRFINLLGPPNVLLVNRGDHFEIAPENDQVALAHNSLQATWADYDADGDPDLYVANDFAPDYLLRNDGAQGFTDVTRDAGGEAMMGFGMGVSWGDYDRDGRLDLYVSNMHSDAGLRITAQVPNLDPRFRRAAEGNLLFRNAGKALGGKVFKLVSGLEASALQVANAGWSWGGQFGDLDNDGFQDIYVSSGHLTAPQQIASGADL